MYQLFYLNVFDTHVVYEDGTTETLLKAVSIELGVDDTNTIMTELWNTYNGSKSLLSDKLLKVVQDLKYTITLS